MKYIPILTAILTAAAPAYAAGNGPATTPVPPIQHSSAANSSSGSSGNSTTGSASDENQNNSAQKLVGHAVNVVKTMESDKQLAGLMKKAKGLFIVPDFGRGAFIIGGRGGAGLVTVRENGKWSDPAFYDIGGISLGAQVGGSGGPVAFLLMDQSAVDAFKSGNKFSLNTGAGLSIVDYSANSQASWGKGDIIMWSNTAGAYVGATVSVTDINWSDSNNREYYGKKTDMTQVLNGSVSNANASELTSVLPD